MTDAHPSLPPSAKFVAHVLRDDESQARELKRLAEAVIEELSEGDNAE